MDLLKRITDKELFGTDGLSDAKPYTAARAVLLDENNMVAILYLEKLNFYTLPGGGIDDGETIEQALAREMQEETGCKCDIICELGIIEENSLMYNWSGKETYFARDERENAIMKFIVTRDISLLNEAIKKIESEELP